MVAPDQLKFLVGGLRKKKPLRVPLDRIESHPNYPEARLKDLREIEESIRQEGFSDEYPLRVTPHPTKRGYYQLVDGHKRLAVARKCLHDPDCPGHPAEVPVVVDHYSKDELDHFYEEDNWKRYPISPEKAHFKNPQYCPQCGTKLMPVDNFCPECGFSLK